MNPIVKVNIEIVDRGNQYPISPIEVQGDIKTEVKKYLDKYRHAMSLSKKYQFIISSSRIVGYGKI